MRFLTYADLSPGSLAPQLERVAAAIERDDFRSADVKKLQVGDYYRAKLGDAARLILKFVSHGGQKACLALELLPTHDYARSRFLRGAPVDEAKLPPEELAPTSVAAPPIRYLHPSRATFEVLDKPLSFDDAQDEISRRRPPLVLVGSAGSGKTALLLHLLRRQPGRVAYVTESAWLAQSARGLYVAHDWDPGEQEVDFLSYRQLLESVEVPPGRPATFRDFASFFEHHRQKLKFADGHQCFEELRGVLTADPGGPLTLDQYQALGVRQSIFPPEQRAALHELLPAWEAHMERSQLYEPNLVAQRLSPKVVPRYDFVAVDEVQDLTLVQLSLVLRTLKDGAAFIVAGDANQIVHPNFFAWSKVKTLFWRGGSFDDERTVAVLDVSYRNSEAATRVANRVLALKHQRFGSVDRESNSLMRAVPGVPGAVRAVKTSDALVRTLDQQTRRSTKAAVLVLRDEHKAEARQRFGTPLVFSILEAKGLEYDTIILDRFVSSERRLFAELAEGVDVAALGTDQLEYRRAKDKGDRSLEAYKFFVNALYVGLTRAVTDVWLVEDDLDHPLLRALDVQLGGDAKVEVRQGSTEDWQREAVRLEAQGKLEQAEAIRSNILKIDKVPWHVMDEAQLRATATKALEPGGVSRKAKEQLFDYACFFESTTLTRRLGTEGRFEPASNARDFAPAVVRRVLQPFTAKNLRDVLWNTEKYGVDYRTQQNLTPLMMAAVAGNLPLVEALLDRGASLQATDHLGHSAVHWVVRRALRDPEYAQQSLGPLYDLLAPPSFDVQVDGRLVQVGRELGEYFLFLALCAHFDRKYASYGRAEGFNAAELCDDGFTRFPDIVVRESRRKRTYVNHVLARSEASSSYATSRRLWVRERQGHYVPNPAVSLRVLLGAGEDRWVPLLEVLNLKLVEDLLVHTDRAPPLGLVATPARATAAPARSARP